MRLSDISHFRKITLVILSDISTFIMEKTPTLEIYTNPFLKNEYRVNLRLTFLVKIDLFNDADDLETLSDNPSQCK